MIEQIAVNAAHESAAFEVEDMAAVVHIDADNGCDEGENEKDEEGGRHAVENERIERGEHVESARNGCESFHHRCGDPIAIVCFHLSSSFCNDAITASTSRFTSARSPLSTGENADSFTP